MVGRRNETEGCEVAGAQCVNFQWSGNVDVEDLILRMIWYAVARATELAGKQYASTARHGTTTIPRTQSTGTGELELWPTSSGRDGKGKLGEESRCASVSRNIDPQARTCAIDATYLSICIYA